MSANTIQFIGGVIVVVGAVAGSWLTSRAALRSTSLTTAAADKATEIDREDRFIQNLERRLQAQDEEIIRVRNAGAEETRRCLEEAQVLRHRVDRLEMERLADRRVIENLRRYVNTLRDLIINNGHELPAPPPGLPLDFDDH